MTTAVHNEVQNSSVNFHIMLLKIITLVIVYQRKEGKSKNRRLHLTAAASSDTTSVVFGAKVTVLDEHFAGHVSGCFFALSDASLFFISHDVGPLAKTVTKTHIRDILNVTGQAQVCRKYYSSNPE